MITRQIENVRAVATAAPIMPQIGGASPPTAVDARPECGNVLHGEWCESLGASHLLYGPVISGHTEIECYLVTITK